MAHWNGLRIAGMLLILSGLVFLAAAYSNGQQSLYGAASALISVGSLFVALGANQKPNA